MENLKKLIKKSKRHLKANKDVITTFNGAVKTDMDAAVQEVLKFGELYGWEGCSGNCRLLWKGSFRRNSSMENKTELSIML